MKQLLSLIFCSFLLIASCKCNNDADKANADMDSTAIIEDTTLDAMAADGAAGRTGTTIAVPDEDFRRLYNVESYSAEEVRRFREMHDEMDWGNVPGFYPEGSTRELTESDTKYLTKWGHSVMLNEIYARHGMTFTDGDLRSHFGRFEWYNPRANNVQSELTALEQRNIEFLKNHQPNM